MPFVFGYFILIAGSAFICGFFALWIAFFAFRPRFTNWMALRAYLLGAAFGALVPFFCHDAKVGQGWLVLSVLAMCAFAGGLLSGISFRGLVRNAISRTSDTHADYEP